MSKNWKTKLIHSDAQIPQGFRSLATPVYRGSTVLFPSAGSVTDDWDQYEAGYSYGLYGTPTVLELAARVCELEHGYRSLITPGGQSAIALINFALLKSGDHILVPHSIYGPNRHFASRLLQRFGVETTFYDPSVGADIQNLCKTNTRLIWTESPGSVTMEVQDLPAICTVAHQTGALVVLDNTWSAGIFFDAFEHGVDVTMQALTKYVGGHSDLLLGSITASAKELYDPLGNAQQLVGTAVSPDEASLALRGMKTMAARLKAIETSALELARWLSHVPQMERVLHPALESCPGHSFWKRDFTGSTGLFSVVFRPEFTKSQVQGFVDRLELFEIGYSWGGVTSLAVAYDFRGNKYRPDYGHRLVRLNIGLEDIDDLRADLQQALAAMR